MSNNVTIRIARDSYIQNSIGDSIIRLNQINHIIGVYTMSCYKKSEDEIDTVVAVGIKNGIGKDCYSIVSYNRDNIIWGIFYNTLPDVSLLIHGEVYLYYVTSTDSWYKVFYDSVTSSRTYTELEANKTYKSLEDGTTWVTGSDKKAKCLNNLYSKEEVDELVGSAESVTRYVAFDSLTTSQKNSLRGDSGSVDNFVVLTQNEYDALTRIDPNKFYFIYEDTESSGTYAYVEGNVLYISGTVTDGVLTVSGTVTDGVLTLSSEEPETEEVSAPILSALSGFYSDYVNVSISCDTSGATIRYTTDGTEPTATSSLYTGVPITITTSCTFKARGFKTGYTYSQVTTANYDIDAGTVNSPVFSPIGGTYSVGQTVTLSSGTSGADIYYTLDGTTPTTSSTKYTEPITLSTATTLTIKALGVKEGYRNSNVSSATYTTAEQEKVNDPVFSPTSGTLFTTTQQVTLTTTTSGADIYYTLDGTEPTSSSTKYTAAFSINETKTIKAIGIKEGCINSNIITATYTKQQEQSSVTGNILTTFGTVVDNVWIISSEVGSFNNNVLTLI